MKIDIVNTNKETVGSLDLKDEVFGGRVKTDLIWEAVVHENAAERRGTHATKNRARQRLGQEAVAPEGHRPRPRRRDPQPAVAQGRHRVRAAAAQLRLRAAAQGQAGRAARGARGRSWPTARWWWSTSSTRRPTKKTKTTVAMFKTLGVAGKTLVIDVKHDEAFTLSARNIAGVRLVPSSRVTARDVMDTDHVIATREALEKLQELAGSQAMQLTRAS